MFARLLGRVRVRVRGRVVVRQVVCLRVVESTCLAQVGVRQVAREGGLFEIIFYPFQAANGTLEVSLNPKP